MERQMRNPTTRQSIKLLSFGLLTIALGLVQAQAKSDFTGTWKINPSKSDFGPMPPPDSVTEKITQQDPDIKANVVTKGGAQGDMTYDVSYNTEGKETTNTVAGNEFKSTAKWDGADLSIDTKGSFSGTEFTSKDRWTLLDDGKTLSVSRHISSAMGDADMKMVFEKQ
jgi:hypothetical protein